MPPHESSRVLTIYECPECGSLDLSATRCESLPSHDRRRAAVPVFREEDVRPLWGMAREAVASPAWAHSGQRGIVDAFPAPDEWKAEPNG